MIPSSKSSAILPKIYIRDNPQNTIHRKHVSLRRPLVLLLIPLLTIGALYITPGTIRPAHADGLTGLVCIADVTATSCPLAAPTLAGPQPSGNSQHFLVRVLVDSSAALNGFDITLLTDSSILQPSDATVGAFLANPHEVVKCIGGVNKIGTSACPSIDNANTIEYAVTGSISSSPATGVLFQADYLVVGNTANSPISFQTGCTNTSVSGGVCVTIESGATVPDIENSQTAKFTNTITGYFDITPSTRTIQVSKGDPPDTLQFVTITSLNSFSGTVTLSASCSPSGPICSIVPPTDVIISSGNPGTGVLNVTVGRSVNPGNYVLNVTGTSGTLPSNSITIQVIVPTPDFTITPSPPSLKFNVTSSGNATIAIASTGNFNGTVTFSLTTNDPALVSASLLNQTLHLSAKGANSTKLTVRASIYGGYTVNVTATSGSLSHTISIGVTVLDFILQVPNKVLTVVNGSLTGGSETVAVDVPDYYNVTVTFSNTIFVNVITQNGIKGPSSGLNVACSPTTVVILSINNATVHSIGTGAANCKVTARAVGNYTVTLTASSGAGSRTSTHEVTFPVTVIAPGFAVAISSSVETVPVSGVTKINVTIANNGLVLNGNITVVMTFSSSDLSINPASVIVILNSTSQTFIIPAIITTSSTTPPGDYLLTITAACTRSSLDPKLPCNSTPSTETATMLLIVIETTSPHDLTVYSVTPSSTSATTGSVIDITITVTNNGKQAENAMIQAIVSDQTIGTMNVTGLPAGQNATVTIPWNTSGYSPGAYVIGGKVAIVTGETNSTNNLMRYSKPVTLNAANTGILNSAYTLPLIIIGVIVVAAIAIGLFLLPRRKPVPAQ